MAKIRTLVKTKKQNTTCTAPVPHLYRYRFASGVLYRYRFKVYRYRSPKMPRMFVFLPFFHMLIPKSTQYSMYTSKPLQIHLIISFLLKLSFNTHLSSKLFKNYSQNKSIMGHNPYINQIQGFVRVCSNPNSFTLQLNHESNLKERILCFSCTFGVLPTLISIIFGLS